MRPTWKELVKDILAGGLEKKAFSRGEKIGGVNKPLKENPETIILLPGFLNSDKAMEYLRHNLIKWGFKVIGYNDCASNVFKGIKRRYNMGWSEDLKQAIVDKTVELTENEGVAPTLIGWSLGGVYSLDVLRSSPETVSKVITLGSPIREFADKTSVKWLYNGVGNKAKDLDEILKGINIDSVAGSNKTLTVCATNDGLIDYNVCFYKNENNFFAETYHMSIMNCSTVVGKVREFLSG